MNDYSFAEARKIFETAQLCRRWKTEVRRALWAAEDSALSETEPWRGGTFEVHSEFLDNSGGGVYFHIVPEGCEPGRPVFVERWDDAQPADVAARIHAEMRRIEAHPIFQFRHRKRLR